MQGLKTSELLKYSPTYKPLFDTPTPLECTKSLVADQSNLQPLSP